MNQAILLTPPGAAAIAVVRLAGELTPAFLARHFSRAAVEGKPIHGTLADGNRVIDDPVLVVHGDGKIADLSVHGGPWVVKEVLDLARRGGFDVDATGRLPLADAAVDGEDPIERLVYAHLPLVRTELALRWLLAQPPAWRRPVRSPPDSSLRWLLSPPRVAIVGAANVGKSTLANELFAQERSITADVPGTTRDWVGEMADLDGLAVFLVDTPGLRQSDDAVEQAAIRAAGAEVQKADLIVLVVDGGEPIEQQRQWTARYPAAVVVRNKCDRANSSEPIDAARPHVCTIAHQGIGVDWLRQSIRRRFIRAWRHPRRAIIRGQSCE